MTRVALFTGSRSEWSLQLPIARAIAADPRLELALIVGGQHLDADFGATIREVKADGFDVAACVPIEPEGDTAYDATKAIGIGIEGIADVLHVLAPAWVVVYGDRFESFAACVASTQMGIATAHVEGGDYTAGGCLDDANRHAMSKLAHLHFATNEQAADRLRRMGEEPWRVHAVGLPSLDLAAAGEYASAEELRAEFAIGKHQPVVLFVLHPVPVHDGDQLEQLTPCLKALQSLATMGFRVIALYPNADAGGRAFICEMHRRLDEVPNVTVHASLGQRRFHGLMKLIGDSWAGCIAGNSSAAIKEAPWFRCPAVNIGTRQNGRLRAGNVIECMAEYDHVDVINAVCSTSTALPRPAIASPYGAGNAGPRICELLATTPRDGRLMAKRMTY